MRITVNGVKLFIETIGSALKTQEGIATPRATIVMLHGGPGLDHSVFNPAFEPLSQYAQIVLYDHRASGRSDDGDRSLWTIEQWADDVAGVITTLGLDKPIVLGTSFGGFVAQRFAAKYPDLLSGLVLMSTAAKPKINLTLEKFKEKGGVAVYNAAKDFFSNASQEGVVERYFSQCLAYYTVSPIDLEALARIPDRSEVMMHFFEPNGEMYNCDFTGDLMNIQTPTLILHGEDDIVFPVVLAEKTLSLLKHNGHFQNAAEGSLRLVKIPHCGHLSEQDDPHRIMDEIIQFFSL